MKRLGIMVELYMACTMILWLEPAVWADRPASQVRRQAIAKANHVEPAWQPSFSDGSPSSTAEWSEWSESDQLVSSCGPNSNCGPVQHFLDWSRCDLSVGATAFSNASNFLTTGSSSTGQIEGSFGFQESLNIGNCMPGLMGGQIGGQIGLRAIQSQLNGNVAGDDARNQLFVTAGMFRRVDYGLQGGLVVDYVHDDWLAVLDLSQVRGELSFALTPCHDAGFRFTSSLNSTSTSVQLAGLVAATPVSLSALDSYRFFYRCGLGEEGRSTAEVHAGFTEDKDALLGLSLNAPLHGAVGLSTTGTYLIPHRGSEPAYAFEGWNLGVALVWTPGRLFGCGRDYYRPIFDVADNGTLLTKRP